MVSVVVTVDHCFGDGYKLIMMMNTTMMNTTMVITMMMTTTMMMTVTKTIK